MYIEGNALILGDSSYLEHHGILGQKWGVRRFQNADGTRTAAGKTRDQKNAAKTVKNARLFRASANAFQGTKFGAGANKRALKEEKAYGDMAFEILNNGKHKAEYDDLSRDIDAVASFEYEEYSKKRDAMIEINARISLEKSGIKNPNDEQVAEEWVYWADFDEDWGADLKCNSYDRYLVSKGYNPNEIHKRYKDDYAKLWDLASKDAEEYLGPYGDTKITYKDKYTKETVKTTAKEELANKIVDEATMWMDDYGAAKRADLVYTDKELSEMRAEDAKYSPLKHSALFIEDGTLYLSHHGIRGQRWGVRRFQNRDGSLTNAGRKRLGYATKGAVQTVGKAFKAGVKAGGNAVKAVKAHHEKKEAEKLEKKKEKASKTRLGVMANKDLFTNEEIRKLNERFKLEDEMKMATLQKGVEIAKAVGTIAQNVGTVAKAYEDVTGTSLSPIKRKAAEEKARQDKEDRERRIAREDADEARKAAKEERDIAIHEQTLRKAIASADTQEFTAQKTKAEADSSILDLYKKGQDFNGGSDATGKSWVEKAKNGGKNPFDDMIADRDPEYAQIRKEHDEKVARKERIAELERREKEREAEKAAANRPQQPQQKQGGGDDALFSQKGSLPIDKDRYRNNRAMEKAKRVKEDAAEERAKKQDEKAVNRTIDDTIEANRSFKETVRAQDPHAYDRGVAKDYIKGKLNNLPNALADLNPINRAAKKIADKATKEEEAQVRKSMKDQYDQMVKNNGRDEANYVMYQTRVANLQQQGYSERKAKQIADSDPTFSAKRNRKVEYSQKVKDLDDTHRKNAEEIRKANKELTDYYYKLVNGPGYDPGTPKREALDRTYRQKRGELERLEKDNNDMLEKGTKEAKKILEHSFSIQNGVLFIDSSDSLAHHGVKGQRWGVRRFQNEDGSLTPKGRKHYEKAIAKIDRMQTHSDARRGRLERQHPFAVTGSAIAGAIAAGLSIAATGGASVAMIAAGSAITGAVSAGLTHVSYSASEAWEGRGTKHRQNKRKEYEEMLNHDGLIVSDGTLYLEHHGVKGQRWGVRRFQNADGTRTALGKKREMYGATVSVRGQKSSESIGVTKKQAKGKAAAEILKSRNDLSEKERKSLQKHVDRAEKETAKLEKYKEKKKREQERNTEESKVRAWQALGSGVISPDKYKQNIDAINKNHKREIDYLNKMDERDMANERAFTRKTVAKGMGYAVAATAGLAGITAAATGWMVISGYAAVGGGMVGAISGEMKRAQYREERRKEMGIDAKHDALSIQNGTLFIDAGDPYLEHHGVLGMKWGKHLRAGKGPIEGEAGAGGGASEDDEKLKEMAKKAGMSVAEYRQKFASKLGSAAGKVGEKVYDAAGGSHKKNAEGWRKMAQEESNAARASEKSSHENSARAASQDRKYGSGGDVYRRAADSDKENAETHRSNAKARSERAASEQAAYEKSLAGKYDKMKADRARKKSAKEKKRLLTQTSAEAKRVSIKDKHLVIDRSRSGGATSRALAKRYLPFDRENSAARPKDTRSFKQKAYDALGGKYKTQAAEAHKDMVYYKNKADDSARRANAQSRAVKDAKKKGAVQDYIANKEGARQLEEEAKGNRFAQWDSAKKANSAQWKYDHSIAGLYDKATGKYKQSHKKTQVPKLMDQAKYYYKEGSNNKLYNNGASKAKTAKEQAKAEVWKAADHVINSHDYYNQSYDPTVTAYGLDTAYRKEAVKYGRLAEGSYRRAAALGKQASNETSTSSRPRARKKKHTSGGFGVVVRRPGRKPVSRTKRVTQSSTGVKRRGATGTGARVRRGA